MIAVGFHTNPTESFAKLLDAKVTYLTQAINSLDPSASWDNLHPCVGAALNELGCCIQGMKILRPDYHRLRGLITEFVLQLKSTDKTRELFLSFAGDLIQSENNPQQSWESNFQPPHDRDAAEPFGHIIRTILERCRIDEGDQRALFLSSISALEECLQFPSCYEYTNRKLQELLAFVQWDL